ncbi:hypothetical protein MTP99_015848 [Tenebrio molitor]|nr:hypothetical protein MTP99_015848 [Tenebrio molitor]
MPNNMEVKIDPILTPILPLQKHHLRAIEKEDVLALLTRDHPKKLNLIKFILNLSLSYHNGFPRIFILCDGSSYFYDNPHTYNIYNYNNELQYKSSDDNNTRKRKVAKDDTCSICMESVHSSALSLPKDAPSSAISLPCNHLFHTECVKAWFDMNKTCPNCRALAPTSM